ncbi:hybrid-cluster NAD(P)-dependent oxidoreductase [Poseidonocella sp. HB161398]|uniref:hybrid-cluster NAD(P)-dependent oxidoreductase n=1 Tax=Poseidonocella sp. HB161398 TaxID=2320855 RepID=UPI001108A0D3|nr:hybrid-cluster NAD(P)-dependent oxidoreductase [Poseidonocella sp. HB161398]
MTKSFTPPMPLARPADLPQLLFGVFAFVADGERDITPQEVRRFQTLLKETGWTENDDLRAAAAALRDDYAGHWSRYEERTGALSLEERGEALGRAEAALGVERSKDLRKGLKSFLVHLERGSHGGGMFGAGEARGRARARAELRGLLDSEARALPVPAEYGAEAAPVATALPAPADGWPAAALAPGGPGTWEGGRTRVRCVSAVSETHDTKTYTFVAEPRCLFHFRPGQFVTLELPVEGRLLRRSYTISSSPSRPYALSVTVKRVPKGWVSNWLYDNMAEGMDFDLLGPSGTFSCLEQARRPLLLLSGGSGVTPVMSMLRWIADTCSDTDVVFLNHVRTPQDIIFHQELLHLSAVMGARLKLAIVPGEVPPGQVWNGLAGRFSAELLQQVAPDLLQRTAYVCGPAGFMQAAKAVLERLGLPAEQYHDESFGGAASVPAARPAPSLPAPAMPAPAPVPAMPAPVAPAAAAPAPAGTTVTLGVTGGSFPAAPGQTILEAAEAAGVALESSCRSGVCGACKLRRSAGAAAMPEQPVLSEADIEGGYLLTCIACAEEDVTLEA